MLRVIAPMPAHQGHPLGYLPRMGYLPGIGDYAITPGSRLLYTVTTANDPLSSEGSIESAFAAAVESLSGGQFSVQGSSASGGGAVSDLESVVGAGSANITYQFTILDSIGNAASADAKSILDAAMEQATSGMIVSSNVALVPTGSAAEPPVATPGITPVGAPLNPAAGQTFTDASGNVWTWNGVSWAESSSMTAWLEQNAGWLALGMGGIVLVAVLLKKL